MKYINYIQDTILKDIYKELSFYMFKKWNSELNSSYKIEDKKDFLNSFCKYLYKAKLEMINKYPNSSLEYNEKFGYFIGYFSSTITIHWKEKYNLKYQKDYDKLIWLQSLNIALKNDENLKNSIKSIYCRLRKTPNNNNIDISSSDYTISKLSSMKFHIDDEDIDNNMLYLVTMLLDKLDIKSVDINLLDTKYSYILEEFTKEPLLKINKNSKQI